MNYEASVSKIVEIQTKAPEWKLSSSIFGRKTETINDANGTYCVCFKLYINAFIVKDLQSKGNLYVDLLQITGFNKVFTLL